MQEELFQKIISSEEFKQVPEKKDTIIRVNINNLKNKEIIVYKYSKEEIIILLKTKITYKDNFEALLYHTFHDISKYIFLNKKQYLNIPYSGIFEELYVKKVLSNHLIEAYFDLN